jgi:hypothetical protein
MTEPKLKYPAHELLKYSNIGSFCSRQDYPTPENIFVIYDWPINIRELNDEFNSLLAENIRLTIDNKFLHNDRARVSAENEALRNALENLCSYSDIICDEGSDMCGDTYQSDGLKEIFAEAAELLTEVEKI